MRFRTMLVAGARGGVKSMGSIVSNLKFGSAAPAGDEPSGQVRPAAVVQLPPRAGAPDYAGMLAAIGAGDRGAESRLMHALRPPLEVVLRHRARHAEGVEDLCQDALIAVLQAAREGRINDPEALVQYALQTARGLALNAERKRSRRNTFAVADMSEVGTETAVDGGEVLEAEQLRGCVDAVLAAMPSARDRQLLHQYYLQESTSGELQTQYAMDSAQLGKVLHRARQRFAQLWRALQPDALA